MSELLTTFSGIDHEALERDAQDISLRFEHSDTNYTVCVMDRNDTEIGKLLMTHPPAESPNGAMTNYFVEIEAIRVNDSIDFHSATLRSIRAADALFPDVRSIEVIDIDRVDGEGNVIEEADDSDVAKILEDIVTPRHLAQWSRFDDKVHMPSLLEKRIPETEEVVAGVASGSVAVGREVGVTVVAEPEL